MKIGLVTRGKWTSKNDISQDVHTHTHTHTHIWKSEVSKYYIIVNALYILEFYYFLCVALKLYMIKT